MINRFFNRIAQFRENDLFSVSLLAIVWLAAICMVNPHGNFPLNDDWEYGRTVERLIKNGDFQLPGEVAVPVLAHALWGALFSLMFGFSFTVLRFSTLILGFMGIILLYTILREANVGRPRALFGAASLMVNPLYFLSSYTFMTDVPFVVWSLSAFLFFLRTINRNSKKDALIGTGFACLAILTRQVAFIIPLSYGITYWMKNKRHGNRNHVISQAFFPLAVSIIMLFGYETWLQTTGRLPVAYNCHISFVLDPLSRYYLGGAIQDRFFQNAVKTFAYLGLFFLPILLLVSYEKWRALTAWQKKAVLIISVAATLLTIMFFFSSESGRHITPYIGNLLNSYGFGPILLPASAQFFPDVPIIFRFAVTGLAIPSGIALIWHLIFIVKKRFLKFLDNPNAEESLLFFSLLACVFYGVPLMTVDPVDRYFLFFIPMLICILLVTSGKNLLGLSRFISGWSLVLLIIYGLFSIIGTHDYLSLHRARWQALDELMRERKLSPNQIEGGFEFDAWYAYPLNKKFKSDEAWWWYKNVKKEYMVTLGLSSGYKEIGRYSFQKWMPYSEGHVFLLQKK